MLNPGVRIMRMLIITLALNAAVPCTLAQGPGDIIPKDIRPVPPRGSKITEADFNELKRALADFRSKIDAAAKTLSAKPRSFMLLDDVEIYHKAVRYAVDYDEMFVDKNRDDVKTARAHLETGKKRLTELLDNKPSWITAKGNIVRAYRSKIDHSIQPYGLVIHKDYNPNKPARLDVWWHGRGDTLTEVSFIEGRQKSSGEFPPGDPQTIVLHPYGRFCNASKFAGEVDTFEAIEHVKSQYTIDAKKILARGFSMGGATTWHMAVHHPAFWALAAPGAGFAETPEYNGWSEKDQSTFPWYERKLWRLYNATDYSMNLFNLPAIAYSGEIDKQKQAADTMAREMKKNGLGLTHVIGPKTGHSYEKEAKKIVTDKVESALKAIPRVRNEVRFVTYTLRYNECDWLRIDGLGKHWEQAKVTGVIEDLKLKLQTDNVTSLSIRANIGIVSISIDGDLPVIANNLNGREPYLHFRKNQGKWVNMILPPNTVEKTHRLQGPIDDAFMDRFIMVRPTGQPLNPKLGTWTQSEMNRAISQWRRQFRGDAIIKDDNDITDDDIKSSNLIIWGDPSSNLILKKIVDKLPLNEFGDATALIMIYPNPLNPQKYVVINSGFTFREADLLTNSRQTPKLPDYAVVDINTQPNSRFPGKIVRAGFFDESWKLQKNDGQ